jgi:CRISPR/Cas system CSM-associated protein Csm5 (group 7 of RAMP superfamily)
MVVAQTDTCRIILLQLHPAGIAAVGYHHQKMIFTPTSSNTMSNTIPLIQLHMDDGFVFQDLFPCLLCLCGEYGFYSRYRR